MQGEEHEVKPVQINRALSIPCLLSKRNELRYDALSLSLSWVQRRNAVCLEVKDTLMRMEQLSDETKAASSTA